MLVLTRSPAHQLSPHRLHLEILLQSELPELAADARLLVAAERRERVPAGAVDVDLSGADATGDAERAKAFARRMRTGQVDVNGARFNPLAPFGGYKQSGNGRELGTFGLEEFLEVKSIQL